ncbi:Lipoprotein signal peptidase [Aquicella siphonis]|uniref:Lipoprotein signal peptidase n=1 Tax=Aquicella siphonis TaxID=254247 RepID=A0A5E4PIK4_9COXI|nr:signal peptidase II [Aquicella siphonis]VVC76243.1 Lipoprotein signal peptidase [Aquicella siphonis]
MNVIKKYLGSGWVWLWLAVIVIVIDRYSKIWVVHHLVYQEPLRLLPFFNLTLAYNTGAAFSFLHSASGWQNWFLGGLALLVSIIVLVWLSRLPARAYWMNIALCLVLGGALGNAWDRILYGYVIDFLSFHWGGWHFAIFNIADSAICAGAFMIFAYWLRQEKSPQT